MRELRDHLAWLFRPGRFLFSADTRRMLRVPGWETLAFVHRPEQVRAVTEATHDRPDAVLLGGAGNAFLEPLLGEQSVFLLDGSRHRTARSILGPTLNKKAVQRWTDVIDRVADAELAAARRKRRRFDLGRWCRHLTMRVMCAVVLDVAAPERAARIFKRFEATTGHLANFVAYKKDGWRPREAIPARSVIGRLVRKAIESRVRKVDAELYQLIAARRRVIDSRPVCPGRPVTPLDALIRAQADHGYDDAFIRDNLTALLAAGYDTTGAALAWQFFWLSKEPKMANELRTACVRQDERRLEAFRAEVLRICPPIEILPRRIAPGRQREAQERVGASPRILSGDDNDAPLVCPFVHRTHHDPDVYRSPETFDPERFLNRSRPYRPYEFFPYGLGSRMCIGRSLGDLVLDRVLRQALTTGPTLKVATAQLRPVRRNVSIWPGHVVLASAHGVCAAGTPRYEEL